MTLFSSCQDDDDDDIEPVVIFESLWATIRFMVAAINRGQDYMKASNNVALVPANGTFEFANTLSMAYRCVHSTIPTGRHLIIHPLPTDLCPMVISDSHWFLENLLCLTSNAIKYSDSGDIDLFVTMEPTTTSIRRVHHRVSVQSLAVNTPRSNLESGIINERQSSISNRRMSGQLPVVHQSLTSLTYHLTTFLPHIHHILIPYTPLETITNTYLLLIHLYIGHRCSSSFADICSIGYFHYCDD